LRIVFQDTLLKLRNQYLTVPERAASANLFKSLQQARDMIQCATIKNTTKIKDKISALVREIPGSKIDYIEILDPETLEPVSRIKQPVVIALAVWVGKTRLIDNILVE
jgi:pantoate--beta-alanine ligase